MAAPKLDVIEIVYNAVKRDSIEGRQLILYGLQIFDFFP